MPLPFPHVFLPDVTHITPELLKTLGVSGLLLDIDGTLMQTRDAMPRQAVLDWMEAMQRGGITLYILSNTSYGCSVTPIQVSSTVEIRVRVSGKSVSSIFTM